jgi:hypothetical protein
VLNNKRQAMKNPFIKHENNGAWIAALALGVITVGTTTYLYLKRRNELADAENERKEHADDYLKTPKKKKQKADAQDLRNLVEN